MAWTEALAQEKYLSLTTYRRDGSAASTPVWFVVDEGRLFGWTSASSWKAKRVRRNPRVTIAACDFRGNVHGESLSATARFLSESEGEHVQRLLLSKYPIARRLLAWFTALTRKAQRAPRQPAAYLEILSTRA
jgi:PPOX class probable F420-dependent enzyme